MEDVTYPVHCQDLSLRRKIEKIKDKRVALEKATKAEVVAISSDNDVVVLRSIFCDVRILFFDFIPTQRLNNSTSLQ